MAAKWIKGGRIDDPQIVIDFILAGDVVFNGHKPQNAGWLQNWSISQIKRETGMGRFFIALPASILKNIEASK
ncbi:hypothetical protein WH297_05890 [Ochrobactrum vermis]|uniref:Uncharacterized protein n=1 Tax=Ochrobactrum vermis TaxID=1827297 RepID=A0ABU8PC86_9HYPH|nr:hypothetical protein [Ochrobactrum vermis]MBD7992877.1 hypothetical protein [Ochrobactrum gallinarum]PQZ29764.1 hypothetical protein CQZ93_06025 [Ochrobactrum vermis]